MKRFQDKLTKSKKTSKPDWQLSVLSSTTDEPEDCGMSLRARISDAHSRRSSYFSIGAVQDQIDDGEEGDLYIDWENFTSVEELKSDSKAYKDKLEKLSKNPGIFQGNLPGKIAFLPDEVRDELQIARLQSHSYNVDFEALSKQPALVKQGLGVVLFIDISGFTKLGEHYKLLHSGNPLLAADLLSDDIITILNQLTQVCYNHGGSVAKFAGDALLCTWKIDLLKISKILAERYSGAKSSVDTELEFMNAKKDLIFAETRRLMNIAKTTSYDMMKMASKRNGLSLHGGIGVGNLVHFFLGGTDEIRIPGRKKSKHSSRKTESRYLKCYLVNGFAVEMATKLLEESETGQIKYVDSFEDWLGYFLEHLFFCEFKKGLNSRKLESVEAESAKDKLDSLFQELLLTTEKSIITVDSNINDHTERIPDDARKLHSKRGRSKQLTEDDIADYVPMLVGQKLQGNSIMGNELVSNVSVMFVRLDDTQIRTDKFLYLPVYYSRLDSNYFMDENFQDCLNYLNKTFIALTNSVKKAGGEVRDLIFDDKGCVFICVFSAHNYVSWSEFRAVRAASDIVHAHQKAKIGVASGSCFVGLCGISERADFVIMGDDVNFAARLMANAGSGEILVSPVVSQKIRGVYSLRDEAINVKGNLRKCQKIIGRDGLMQVDEVPIGIRERDVNLVSQTYYKTLRKTELFRGWSDYAANKKKIRTNIAKLGSKFSLSVGRDDAVNEVLHAIMSGRVSFVHSLPGIGKTHLINLVKQRLTNSSRFSKHYKMYISSSKGWEIDTPYYVLRKLLDQILGLGDENVSLSRKRAADKNKEILEILIGEKVQMNVMGWQHLLPGVTSYYTKNNKASKMLWSSPKAHLEALQSLMPKDPLPKEKEACFSLFSELLNCLAKGCFDKLTAEERETQLPTLRPTEVVAEKKQSLDKNSSLIIVKPKAGTQNPAAIYTTLSSAPRKVSVHSDRLTAVSRETSRTATSDSKYVIVIEDLDYIDAYSFEVLSQIFQAKDLFPANVCFVFSLNSVYKIPLRSSEVSLHFYRLSKMIQFRSKLTKLTCKKIVDITINRFNKEQSILAAQKLLYGFCVADLLSKLENPARSKGAFFDHLLRNENFDYQASAFYCRAFKFLLENLGMDYDSSVFDYLYQASNGHVGSLISLTRSYYTSYLFPVLRADQSIRDKMDRYAFLNNIPREVEGTVRKELDSLPGICVWLMKIAAVIGRVFEVNTLKKVCQILYHRENSGSKSEETSQLALVYRRAFSGQDNPDFKALLHLAMVILMRYSFFVLCDPPEPAVPDLSCQRTSVSDGPQLQQNKVSRSASLLTKTTMRRQSNRSQSAFEVGNIRVSSILLEKRAFCKFNSLVDYHVIKNMIPARRQNKIKLCIKGAR